MAATARDVMNRDVLAVRVDMTVPELAAFFSEKQITGAPVVDRGGRLVGVVSVTDIAENDTEEHEDLAPDRARPDLDVRAWEDRMNPDELRAFHLEKESPLVGDIMTPAVYTVPEDTPASLVARTMIAGRIHRLFVTRQGRVIGIVTSLDLLKLLCEEQGTR